MQCQTGWAISDYTNLSRYITCSVQLSQCTSTSEDTKHNEARLTGLCMPTFLWNAKVGSHRNPANCSVGKEVVLTSCKNVTLLCSCGCDLTYTHCWKISHFYKCVWNRVFSSCFWIVIVAVIRPHWDAWVKYRTSHGWAQLLCIAFKWGAIQANSWRIFRRASPQKSSS